MRDGLGTIEPTPDLGEPGNVSTDAIAPDWQS